MGFGPRFFLRSAPRPERSSPVAPARADDIRDLVAPVVGALGCSVYDVEVAGSGKARTVRVLIDREGGVDIDAIAEATRAISPLLDEADPVAGAYLLEVSSPGVERPLRTPAHFAAAVGETDHHHLPHGERTATCARRLCLGRRRRFRRRRRRHHRGDSLTPRSPRRARSSSGARRRRRLPTSGRSPARRAKEKTS